MTDKKRPAPAAFVVIPCLLWNREIKTGKKINKASLKREGFKKKQRWRNSVKQAVTQTHGRTIISAAM
ncbi:hypothetical protein [Alcaligenes faecalis]|uniref:hypothetical protein n=1 Tax=Alcaligenes faecalis TaxID=511 RepID=UPI001C8292D0|nr:hypothetical protein [Alcaligenes faecalis]MBX6963050.1 hypothetical protein [Providencia rettgeri]MBX7029700.1 hypothetical protein [Alcaligenes faecalis]